MFGYIRPLESELRVRELDAYRAVYCGLCRALAKRYGFFARWLINYDLTFYTVLYASLSEIKPVIAPHRCPYNPIKQKPHLESFPGIDISCDLTVLLAHEKCLDNIRDSGFLRSVFWYIPKILLDLPCKQAAVRNKIAAQIISAWRNSQIEIEKTDTDFDTACNPTASAMAGLFSIMAKDEKQERILHRFGYMLGRFIYLCDALEDLHDDAKRKRFNPLLKKTYKHEHLIAMANSTLAQAGSSFALLETRHFSGLLENIVYMGLRSKFDSILKTLQRDERSDVQNI